MNIVVIGKSGQLAFELSREFENSSHQVTFLGRDDIDTMILILQIAISLELH